MATGRSPGERATVRALEVLVGGSLRWSREGGCNASRFTQMREGHGTVDALPRLATSGEGKSGRLRMFESSPEDRSIDAAVVKFPPCFRDDVVQAAAWRLREAREDIGGSGRNDAELPARVQGRR